MLRDDAPALGLRSADFARRFLQLRVRGECDLQEPEWGFGSCWFLSVRNGPQIGTYDDQVKTWTENWTNSETRLVLIESS